MNIKRNNPHDPCLTCQVPGKRDLVVEIAVIITGFLLGDLFHANFDRAF